MSGVELRSSLPRFATAMIAGVPVSEVGPVLRSNPLGTVYEEWLTRTLKASKAYFAQLGEAFTAMCEAAKSTEAGAQMTPAVARFVVTNVIYTNVLIAPIAEELVYRALLQRQLQRLVNERWVQDGDGGRDEAKAKVATRAAYVVCSIIFGFAHVPVMEVVAGPCVFDLSESGRPAPREPASEPRKQKTKNKGGARGPGFKSEAGVVKRSFLVS